MRPTSRTVRRAAVGAAWLAAATAGVGGTTVYSAAPGARGDVAFEWPSSALARAPGAATLVLFVHRKCPCTRATLRELERAYVHVLEDLTTKIVFVGEASGSSATHREALRLANDARLAGAITVVEDPTGDAARRFGAKTSGEALLYDREGLLMFHGGLTRERGHEGPNRGVDAVVASILDGAPGDRETPVFGCSLGVDE